MAFVKFTNLNPPFQDMPLWVNTDYIMSVYEQPNQHGGVATMVHNYHGKDWRIEESLSQAIKIIKDATNQPILGTKI
jgi:hypothetical protein